MIKSLNRCEAAVASALERFLTLVVAALVVDVLWGVVSRFILGAPSRWTEEVATFLLIWLTLLGAAVAFRYQEHLGVDFFVGKLDSGAQRLLRALAATIVVMFAASVLVGGGMMLVVETLRAQQRTPALGILMGYVYVAVPLSGACITLFTLKQIMVAWHAAAADGCQSSAETSEVVDG